MVWYKLLEFLPDELFVAACDELLTQLAGTQVPNPRRIQEVCCDILEIPKGEAAWERFLRSVAGGAEKAPIPNAAVRAGVDACGGAKAIGRADHSHHPFLRREFALAYDALRLTLLRPHLLEQVLLGGGDVVPPHGLPAGGARQLPRGVEDGGAL